MSELYLSGSEAVKVLNSLVEVDSDSVCKLVESRVPCSQHLEKILPYCAGTSENPTLGILGVLNLLFGGPSRGGFIAATWDLVCPKGCELPVEIRNLVEGNPCPFCSSPMVQGDFLGFRWIKSSGN